MLTTLNASQLLTGTIPGTAFPANLSIASSFTVPTFAARTASVTSYYEFAETTCATLAPSGKARLCLEQADHTLKASLSRVLVSSIAVVSVSLAPCHR